MLLEYGIFIKKQSRRDSEFNSFLRNVGYAFVKDSSGRVIGDVPALYNHRTRFDFPEPGNGFHQLTLAITGNTCDSKYFILVNAERDPVYGGAPLITVYAKILDPQNFFVSW